MPLTNYYSGHRNKKNEMDGGCSTYGDMRGTYRFLVEKPEGRPRRRSDDNIKIDLQEVECVEHGLD